MEQGIKDYIKACEENIILYKALGDERAVKAAQQMIRDFEEVLKEIQLIREV